MCLLPGYSYLITCSVLRGISVSSPAEKSSAAPLSSVGRIKELDIIRGFALFGILLVNMKYFMMPLFYTLKTPSALTDSADMFGYLLIQLLATGKFYAIFSFLFGLGFYIFIERLAEKGLTPEKLFRRRLAGLLLIGLIHLVIIWSGDILVTYALTGLILPAFSKLKPQSLAKWIVALFITALLFSGASHLVYSSLKVFFYEDFSAFTTAAVVNSIQVFQDGGFGEIFIHRMQYEVSNYLINYLVSFPGILAYFLCGLYAGKTAVFTNTEGNLAFIRRVWYRGFVTGVLFLLVYLVLETGTAGVISLWRLPLLAVVNYAGAIFLSMFYISSLVLLLRSETWRKILLPLSAAGRMALTNYLAQSVICVIIFYGYGFGLFGRLKVAEGILLTIIILTAQVIFSNIWLKRFKFGPMEWLWRAFTYGRKP